MRLNYMSSFGPVQLEQIDLESNQWDANEPIHSFSSVEMPILHNGTDFPPLKIGGQGGILSLPSFSENEPGLFSFAATHGAHSMPLG